MIILSAESDFELFFKKSLDLMVFIGFDNRFKFVNPSFERILGWKEEEVISKPFQDFLHPDDIERSTAKAQEVGDDVIRFENRYRCKDGSYRWISWSSHPIPEKQIVVGVGRDITERKKAEEALQNSEKQKNDILESITDGFVAFDKEWRYTYVNSNAARMLHTPKEELICKVGIEVFPNASKFLVEFKRAVSSGRPVHFEEYYPEPLNIWYECHATPLSMA